MNIYCMCALGMHARTLAQAKQEQEEHARWSYWYYKDPQVLRACHACCACVPKGVRSLLRLHVDASAHVLA